MKYQDYYKILGVDRDASQDEIKKAYRRSARKYHPDVSKEKNAEERFKELGEAYEVLRDPEKRSAYNQFGSSWKQGQEFRPPPSWNSGFSFTHSGDTSTFSDFFESLFGGAVGGRSPPSGHGFRHGFAARGPDHQAKIRISLEDAYSGSSRSIELSQSAGMSTAKRTLQVTIPKGVINGQKIRLAGQGGKGAGGGANGDLFLELDFLPHRIFSDDGKDIYLDLPVAPWEAAMGSTIEVPTLGGKVSLKIPPGSQTDSRLRLKGRGLPGNSAGDQFVVLKIVAPPADSAKSRSIYKQMRDELGFDPRKNLT
ncbi:MAG: DnaJ domain-containing protein [Gammaproteobacteria bacterium]|nr:DnaJ domain-containing protein [Gammaproteobacteria bacterium]MCZ6827685.1 DnaJ domain-containing protein [Gammaproteobacteria bacterium]